MSGKIAVSSGTEDLTSKNVLSAIADSLQTSESQEALLIKSLMNTPESQESLLGMFFPVNAEASMISAAFENFDGTLPNNKPQDGSDCGCDCEKRKPLASKVIDAEGNAHITILYDGNSTTGGGDTGMFTGLINAASENDVVDITIMTTLFNFAAPSCNIFATLSLLSAIQHCKAKVITRAGCLCSVGDCAVWLSGDDRRMSPMGWLAVKQPTACCGGTLKDAEFRAEDFKAQLKVFTDYIVNMGLMTSEEITRMYEDQAIISLSYDELDARIKTLKKA